ncbi:MAG: hypothetical protein HOP29_06420 [Phycisphaerales bacterium]|nr:hypothetical protein [Phycisphaerales bacterium]
MDATINQKTTEELHTRRRRLRERLAVAWERREPAGTIHQIEDELRQLWSLIDSLGGHHPPNCRCARPPGGTRNPIPEPA